MPPVRRILIVDDDRANRRILQKMFEAEGFVALNADSVEAAQKIIETEPEKIDLVLSDIQMPGKTGFDLVRWMKQRQPDANEVPVLLITSALPEPENRIFGLSLGAIDYVLRSLDSRELILRVTRAIEHFEQLKNLRSTLEDTEDLASAGRLMAATNHEIGNLAQIAKSTASFLNDSLGKKNLDDLTLRALRSMKASCDMLADVSKTMGAMIGRGPTMSTLINLTKEVQSVVEMTKPLLKNCTVDLHVPPEDIWVSAVATHLKQILINFLINARDAIREMNNAVSGHISIHVQPTDANWVRITVRDNGVGLPESGSRDEFQAFASTKQLRGGKGLGLWLSSRFAREMGGNLSLSSEGAGKGATATLELRRAAAPIDINIDSYLSAEEI
jgi:C4-dicarboxylate-specific signal transduction histidine kinase